MKSPCPLSGVRALDRIVHHAEIFTHKGTSYRIAGREGVLPSIAAERQV